jgi:DNA-binding NarL/FixJ family response regulator
VNELRILVADDHEALREGVCHLLERQSGWHVCGVAANGRDAVEQTKKLRPDIAILDMDMPEIDGLTAGRQIKRLNAAAEVLIFTAHETDELIKDVFQCGIKGYVRKSEASTHLVDAIKALAQHKPFFTDHVSKVLFRKYFPGRRKSDSGNRSLTARERKVVRLLADGNTNKEAAAILGLSVRTVESHRAAVIQRLGVGTFAGLVRYAIRVGIISA